ncbi:MAG: hypothetical protein PHV11_06400 [Candidatus Bipolaricaulis sp.]|nr:hypothetical protein [Candidatus Bipolaricaulis sp.]
MKATLELQLMAQGEILQYIPPETYQAIVKKDEHPLFRAYCIGEEGDATPKIVGGGSKVLHWLRAAISAMVQKLQFGTRFFYNHAETNAHAGRTAVGELVGKALEYIGGKMRAVAIAYIYPDYRELPADAVSIEAEVEMDPTGRSNVIDAVHLNKITGIAVGDRRKAVPAFPAAGLVAQLQAFEVQSGEQTGGGKMDLTLDQVKDFLMIRRITPSEVFREEDITRDKTFRAKLQAETEMRERLQKEHDALKTTTEEKLAKLKADNDSMRLTLTTDKAKTLASALIEERKLDPEKSKFILDLKLPNFKVEGEAIDDSAIKGQLNKFLDASIDEYARYEAVFKPAAGAGQQQQTAGQDKGNGGAQDGELLARNV